MWKYGDEALQSLGEEGRADIMEEVILELGLNS